MKLNEFKIIPLNYNYISQGEIKVAKLISKLRLIQAN